MYTAKRMIMIFFLKGKNKISIPNMPLVNLLLLAFCMVTVAQHRAEDSSNWGHQNNRN